MNRRKEQGIIILVASVAAMIAIASSVGSTETYNGAFEDLFIDENDLPEGFAWKTCTEGWTFAPAEEGIEDPLNTHVPSVYESVIFVNANEGGDSEEALIQIVSRYFADDIDAIFDNGDWTSAPAPGFDGAIEDENVRAKVTYYDESGARNPISILITKKDIVMVFSYVSYTDFDYDIFLKTLSK